MIATLPQPNQRAASHQDFQINDYSTPCPIVKYVDDGTMYEVCTIGTTSNIQESVDVAINWSVGNDACINSDNSKGMYIKKLCPNCT